MARIHDFTRLPLTEANLRAAFAWLYAELAAVSGYAPMGYALPRLTTTGHLGAELNAAVDGVDTAINLAAALLGRSAPANGARTFDFTTGNHDAARLHSALDRLHSRISAMSKRSSMASTIKAGTIYLQRSGSKSAFGTSSTWSTFTDSVGAIGMPTLNRRNLIGGTTDPSNTNFWTLSNCSVVALGVGPDGLSSAYKIVDNSTNNVHQVQKFVSSAIPGSLYTWSVFVKAVEKTWFWMNMTDTQANACYFDLTNGVVGSTTGGAVGTITPIPSAPGWYRCSITRTVSQANVTLAMAPANGNIAATYTGTGSGGVLIWTPQLDLGALSGPQPTNTTGVDLSQPWAGTGVLIEGSATNLCLSSEAIDQGPWSGSGAGLTLTPDATTSPIGTATADQITSTAGTYGDRFQNIAMTNGATYTASIWLKAAAVGGTLRLRLTDNVGSSFASAEFAATGSWQRVSVTGQNTTGGTGAVRIATPASGALMDVYVWGCQVEQLTYPDTYLPTGSSATVTKADDHVVLAEPHNLVAWSQDFDQWTKGSGAITITKDAASAPDGTQTADTMSVSGTGLAATADDLYMPVSLKVGQRYTMSIWLRLISGTATGVRIGLRNGGGLSPATFTPTSDWYRATLTFTYAQGDSFLFDFANVSTGGSMVVAIWGAQIVEAPANTSLPSMPGPYVRTWSAIAARSGIPIVDPAFWQNGFVEFWHVWPFTYNSQPPAGNNITIAGPNAGANNNMAFRLWRFSGNTNGVFFDRSNDASSSTNFTKARINIGGSQHTDGTIHRVYLYWRNYTDPSNGQRYMIVGHQLFDLFGNKLNDTSADFAALYGATLFDAVDPFPIFGGGCGCVWGLNMGYLAPPAGMTPAVNPSM